MIEAHDTWPPGSVISAHIIPGPHNILHKILSEHWSLGPHVAGVRDAAGATLIIIIVILTIHSNHVKWDAQSLPLDLHQRHVW